MILPDTSAWVEFLRGTGSPVDHLMAELLAPGEDVVTVGAVIYEVLAGARDEDHFRQLRRLLGSFGYLRSEEPYDFEMAASIYRRCRGAGHTLRSHADCQIAAMAIRSGARVLHSDADFDAIASCTSLVTVEADGPAGP